MRAPERDESGDPSALVFAYTLLAVPGHSVPFGIRFLAAYIRTVSGRSVPPFALKVIHPGLCVHPYDRVMRAVLLSFLL